VTVAVIVALVAAWLFAAFLAFVLYGFLRQHAALQADVAELKALLQRAPAAQHPPPPPAPQPQPALLQPGARAPEFQLADLSGRSRHLRDFLGRERVLVFFDPQCGFCQQLAPRLGELGDRALVITRRDPAETQRLAEQHGWRGDVLVEPDWAVATAYGTNGTPTGYLIDAQGRIASQLAVGGDALLTLAA
jgi:peroxiredoxin